MLTRNGLFRTMFYNYKNAGIVEIKLERQIRFKCLVKLASIHHEFLREIRLNLAIGTNAYVAERFPLHEFQKYTD